MPAHSPDCRRNPKSVGQGSEFSYYAGFSPTFVSETLRSLQLPADARVVDPWNGSGTTTLVAQELGLEGIGFDINPAAVVIARGRLLGPGVEPSHISLAQQVLSSACSGELELAGSDPLEVWFYPSAAASIRRLERSVFQLLVEHTAEQRSSPVDVQILSSLAARFYVALFRTVRSFIQPFVPSNPTWVRVPPSPHARLRPAAARISDEFERNVRALFPTDSSHGSIGHLSDRTSTVSVASSDAIPLPSRSVDAIVCSPPYCTRIDYAVSTWPELALLGYSSVQFAALRKTMMGSAVVADQLPRPRRAWGQSACKFLRGVKSHPSHGSKRYYYKTHLRYFDFLYRSIREIARVLKEDRKCAIVVQDSFYKELHIDLQRNVKEMCAGAGLKLSDRRDYPVRRNKLLVNTRSRKYRGDATATESVLVFARVG